MVSTGEWMNWRYIAEYSRSGGTPRVRVWASLARPDWNRSVLTCGVTMMCSNDTIVFMYVSLLTRRARLLGVTCVHM